MNRPDEHDYYASRAQSARRMAETASDTTARRAHEEMAKRYTMLLERIQVPHTTN
ncbi:hypothetical protein [Sphingomonas japonica]|uniref:Uncharacterized protein n=1 Tax=Sphingomonas japonica TaxID=511662 RepID=A0ABX0TZB5_9SPHN|nr:hypothetical protein [Sphingomonas japonica]NIJ23589.1 hypothetical protein [Sphingomonas japonica]